MPYINLTSSLILLATLFFVLSDTITSLFFRWSRMDESYSHGFLVLGIVIYLIYSDREKLKASIAPPSIIAVIALFIATLLWGGSRQLGINVLQEMLLPPIIWLTFTSLFGNAFGKQTLLPALFIYFAIPFWDYFAFPLQIMTVSVNELLLDFFSIEAVIDGLFVTLPSIGVFEVANGCSGLRYLIVGMTIASFFSSLNLRQWKYRIVLVAVSVLLSLVANWVRVFLLILIGYKTNMTSSLIEDHELFGWVVFGVSLVPVFILANRLQRVDEKIVQKKGVGIAELIPHKAGRPMLLVTSAIALVGLTLPASLLTVNASHDKIVAFNVTDPLIGWKKLAVNTNEGSFSRMRGYTHNIRRSYYNAELDVLTLELFVYPAQSPGKELVQDVNQAIDRDAWVVSRKGSRKIEDIFFAETEILNRNNKRRYLVLYAYYVAGFFWDDRVQAKLGGLNGFLNNRHDGSLLTIGASCDKGCERAGDNLTKFLKSNIGNLIGSMEGSLGIK